MLKNIAKLEMQIEGRTYSLLCDSDSPMPHLKEFMFQCGAYLAQIEANVKANQEELKKKEEENKLKEVIKTDIAPEAS